VYGMGVGCTVYGMGVLKLQTRRRRPDVWARHGRITDVARCTRVERGVFDY
jgi:hypothetical protein